MQLTPAQATILKDKHRFRILACGRKFGKTTLACEELAAVAIYGNDRRVMYVAPTLGDARRLMWDRIVNKVRGAIVSKNDTRMELTVKTTLGGRSRIFLGSWELFDNYRGDEFDFIDFDEVQDYKHFWVGWNEAMRPTLTPRKGFALFKGTPKGFTHFYDLFGLELKDTDYKSFRYTTYDNPYIPREEIESAKRQLNDDEFSQEYLADFRKSSGLVFKEFDRQKHVYETMNATIVDALGGVDFGYVHPAAALTVLKDTRSHFWIPHEWYKTNKTEADVAEYVASLELNKVYADPESAGGRAELERRKVNVMEVIKGPDSIVHGINKMRELFKQGRLHIHKSCINLISELEMYSYDDDVKNEKPIKEYDHAIDALRYVILMTDYTKVVSKTVEQRRKERELVKQFDFHKNSRQRYFSGSRYLRR